MTCLTSEDVLIRLTLEFFWFFLHKVEIWKILIVGVKRLSKTTNSHSCNKGNTVCK